MKKWRVNRRDFMALGTWAIGGIITAAMGVPAIAYIIGPVLRQNKSDNRIRLGLISKIEIGVPTLFKARITRQSGWMVEEKDVSAYVLTDNGRDFVAISNICTHLACRVRWIAERDCFFCPCHNGVFDRQGNVISGPPPRPLDRYEVTLEGDQLYIGSLYQVQAES